MKTVLDKRRSTLQTGALKGQTVTLFVKMRMMGGKMTSFLMQELLCWMARFGALSCQTANTFRKYEPSDNLPHIEHFSI